MGRRLKVWGLIFFHARAYFIVESTPSNWLLFLLLRDLHKRGNNNISKLHPGKVSHSPSINVVLVIADF